MGFSGKQAQALRRNLDNRHVRMREANGRELFYIEGWYAISEANRIFGFDGWNRETVESRCVLMRENRGTFLAVYVAHVRITVHAAGTTVIREGHGTGEGRGTSPAEVHDVALKTAETDATKRALATFGRHFGLELYRNRKAPLSGAAPPSPPKTFDMAPRLGFHPDDSTPIPRPSRQYGDLQNSFVQHFSDEDRRTDHASADTQLLLPVASALAPAQIDKSVLTIAEPRRLRDKAHEIYRLPAVFGLRPATVRPTPFTLRSTTGVGFESER
jgi:Rad52/22 family double-strand break repair protein